MTAQVRLTIDLLDYKAFDKVLSIILQAYSGVATLDQAEFERWLEQVKRPPSLDENYLTITLDGDSEPVARLDIKGHQNDTA